MAFSGLQQAGLVASRTAASELSEKQDPIPCLATTTKPTKSLLASLSLCAPHILSEFHPRLETENALLCPTRVNDGITRTMLEGKRLIHSARQSPQLLPPSCIKLLQLQCSSLSILGIVTRPPA